MHKIVEIQFMAMFLAREKLVIPQDAQRVRPTIIETPGWVGSSKRLSLKRES
jgi:hypothetical protein